MWHGLSHCFLPLKPPLNSHFCPKRVTILSQRRDSMASARSRLIALLLGSATVAQFACGPDAPRAVPEAQRKAITDSLRHLVTSSYDLSKPDVVSRMMSLYPA